MALGDWIVNAKDKELPKWLKDHMDKGEVQYAAPKGTQKYTAAELAEQGFKGVYFVKP